MNNFYVYILIDPRYFGPFKYGDLIFPFLPFYVGKGKGKRWTAHFKKSYLKSNFNYRKNKTIKVLQELKYSQEELIFIISNNLTETDAFDLEILLIKQIGRSDIGNGPLLNMTDGGDGFSNPSEATRKKMSESRKGLLAGEKNPMFGKKGELHHFFRGKHSESTRQKMKDNHADFSKENHPQWGFHHREESKQLMALGHLKYEYRLISPNGEEIFIDNMRKFCRDNNCLLPCMLQMVKGELYQHKGWIGYIIGKEDLRIEIERKHNTPKFYAFDLDGNKIEIINLKKFSEDLKVNYKSVRSSLNKNKYFKGYKFYSYE